MMNRLKLLEISKALDQQIEAGQPLDDYHHKKALILSEHIKQALNKKEEGLSGDQFLVSKLQQSIDDFEVEHPQLTAIVGRISDLLAAAGI